MLKYFFNWCWRGSHWKRWRKYSAYSSLFLFEIDSCSQNFFSPSLLFFLFHFFHFSSLLFLFLTFFSLRLSLRFKKKYSSKQSSIWTPLMLEKYGKRRVSVMNSNIQNSMRFAFAVLLFTKISVSSLYPHTVIPSVLSIQFFFSLLFCASLFSFHFTTPFSFHISL